MPCVTGRDFETAFQNKLFRFSIQLVLPIKITYFADRNNLFSWAIQLVLQIRGTGVKYNALSPLLTVGNSCFVKAVALLL